MDYGAGSDSRYDLRVRVVWITKYRKRILKGDISVRIRELLQETCKASDEAIVKGHVSQDHVHLLLSYPPSVLVGRLVEYLKGKTSRWITRDYSELSRLFWGQHLWARGYFAASVGTVTDEAVREYIEKQDIETKEGDFKISE